MGEPWKRALTKGRAFLVQNMDFVDSDLWEHVLAEGIVSPIQAENIKARYPANNKQVSAFLDHMQRRPRSDYEKLKEVLRISEQEHVANKLEALEADEGGAVLVSPPQVPSVLLQAQSATRSQPRSNRDALGTGGTEYATNISPPTAEPHPPATAKEIMQIKRKIDKIAVPEKIGATKVIYSTEQQYNDVRERENCYSMENDPRGRGLVVTMTGDREGWQEDVLAVAKMFKYLNVMAEFYFDPKEKELTKLLDDFSRSEMNAYVDCIFVVLMAHGRTWNDMEYLFAADGNGFPVRQKLQEIFDNKVKRVLVDKPKVFLIQMCRGGAADSGVHLKSLFGETKHDACSVPESRKIPTFSDYLIGFATQPGALANRHTKDGAWYIQELYKVVMTQAHHRNVTSMLVEVNRKLEERASREKFTQGGEAVLGLKAPLYLFPYEHKP